MAWSIGRVNNVGPSSSRGSIILAGHRDSHMQFMSKLNIGDKIELMMTDGVLKTFIISKTDVAKQPELTMSALNSENGSLILTTCWPFDSQKPGPERFILTAQMV